MRISPFGRRWFRRMDGPSAEAMRHRQRAADEAVEAGWLQRATHRNAELIRAERGRNSFAALLFEGYRRRRDG